MPPPSPCRHYPDCVGCPLVGTPYGEQLLHKRSLVQRALAAYPSLADVEVPEVVGAPRPFGYRNQAKLVARYARRGMLLGVYRPGTHQVVDIRACAVHHPLIESVLAAVADAVERFRVQVYDERDASGDLRYVIVRVGVWNKTAQVILVTRQRQAVGLHELVRAVRRVRGVVSVAQNVNDSTGNAIFGPTFVSLTPEDSLLEKIGGFKLRTRAGAFLQANPNIAGRIYRQAVEWAAAEGAVAFDLYCGAGALALHLATVARLVVGVEASPIAVADAKVNARLNGIGNTRFHAGDVAQLLPELALGLRPAVICVNPPRKGLDAATRAALAETSAERLIYVSCDPVSLARDLAEFVAAGFVVRGLRAFDMMPQTEHVETVAWLQRGADSGAGDVHATGGVA